METGEGMRMPKMLKGDEKCGESCDGLEKMRGRKEEGFCTERQSQLFTQKGVNTHTHTTYRYVSMHVTFIQQAFLPLQLKLAQ